jgi:hypothetical protein
MYRYNLNNIINKILYLSIMTHNIMYKSITIQNFSIVSYIINE